MHYINSSRGGHGAPNNLLGNGGESEIPESLRSSSNIGGPGDANSSGASSSVVTSRGGGEGPPKVYEEMI